MTQGWIRLYRKLLKSVIFDDEGLLKVWIWALLTASFKEEWVTVKTGRGKTQVKLMPGQFVFQRNIAAKELKMNPATVQKRMLKLKNLQKVITQTGTHYSIYSIVNWPTFQAPQQKFQQATDQPSITQVSPKLCKAATGEALEAPKKLRSKEYISCGKLEDLKGLLISLPEFCDLPKDSQRLITSFLDKGRQSNKTLRIASKRVQGALTDLIAISGETSIDCLNRALEITIEKAEVGQFTFDKQNITGYIKAIAKGRFRQTQEEMDGKYEPNETDTEALYR
jgi:hypothetical protein